MGRRAVPFAGICAAVETIEGGPFSTARDSGVQLTSPPARPTGSMKTESNRRRVCITGIPKGTKKKDFNAALGAAIREGPYRVESGPLFTPIISSSFKIEKDSIHASVVFCSETYAKRALLLAGQTVDILGAPVVLQLTYDCSSSQPPCSVKDLRADSSDHIETATGCNDSKLEDSEQNMQGLISELTTFDLVRCKAEVSMSRQKIASLEASRNDLSTAEQLSMCKQRYQGEMNAVESKAADELKKRQKRFNRETQRLKARVNSLEHDLFAADKRNEISRAKANFDLASCRAELSKSQEKISVLEARQSDDVNAAKLIAAEQLRMCEKRHQDELDANKTRAEVEMMRCRQRCTRETERLKSKIGRLERDLNDSNARSESAKGTANFDLARCRAELSKSQEKVAFLLGSKNDDVNATKLIAAEQLSICEQRCQDKIDTVKTMAADELEKSRQRFAREVKGLKIKVVCLERDLFAANERNESQAKLISSLKCESRELKDEKKRLEEDPEYIQLKTRLHDEASKTSQLEAKLREATRRIEQVKANCMSANANAMLERKQREVTEQRLEKLQSQVKESNAKVVGAVPRVKRKTAPALTLNDWVNPVSKDKSTASSSDIRKVFCPPGSNEMPINTVGTSISILGHSTDQDARCNDLAALIHFEASRRAEKSSEGCTKAKKASVSSKAAVERRLSELDLLQSAFSEEEIEIEFRSNATAVIKRNLVLPIDGSENISGGGVAVDLTLTSTDDYLMLKEHRLEVHAMLSSTLQSSIDVTLGAVDVRKVAIDSLPKLLAACRWEAVALAGEESMFDVLSAAEKWATNEWPQLLRAKKLATVAATDISAAGGQVETKEYEFSRMLMYSHHIRDSKKIKLAKTRASKLDLRGCVKTGTPAFIVVEGLRQNCDSYAQELKGSAHFSILGDIRERVKGIEGVEKMYSLPRKMEEIDNEDSFVSMVEKMGLKNFLDIDNQSK